MLKKETVSPTGGRIHGLTFIEVPLYHRNAQIYF